MDTRSITNAACIDTLFDKKKSIILDLRIANFIVKKRNLAIMKSFRLGAIWNMLDPLLHSLIYLFVFTVIRYNSHPGNLMIGIALIRGLQQNLIYGASSNLDFTAGLKIERVRSRAIVLSELFYVVQTSFYLSFGTVLVLLLLDASYWVIPLMPLFCILNGLVWYSFGRVLSPIVQTLPDFKKIVTYFGMMMFYGSPALYPLSMTRGIHRQINLYNPFAFISEPARYMAFGSDSHRLLDPFVGVIIFTIATFSLVFGLYMIDKQRWRWSTWN
ncbi:ABC transporter permease [Deltaproteobacteria bacterium]|nr:ABC transporter permease [Deltaproteobacteria bacterium]